MPNQKSAEKRAKQNIKRNLRNRFFKSTYRNILKKFMILIDEKKTEDIKKEIPQIQRAIDKACTKGVLSENAASRKKSRLTILVNKVVA